MPLPTAGDSDPPHPEIETRLRSLLDHEASEDEIASFLTFLDDEILRISAAVDSDELQKQRLRIRLREYREQASELQKESRKYQEQFLQITKQTAEYNEGLSSKISDLRAQKKTWMEEGNALRSSKADLEAHLAAQGKLLGQAQNRVFELETQIKADAPKVQRLRDYEKRIEQLTAMHRKWNEDITLYNRQSKEMDELVSKHQKMKMQVDAFKQKLDSSEAERVQNRRNIQILEAKVRAGERRAAPPSAGVQQMIATQAQELDTMRKRNNALQIENEGLMDENDRLQVELEALKVISAPSTGSMHESLSEDETDT